MRIKPGWKALAGAVLALGGSMALVVASFALAGFPFKTEIPALVIWGECAFLLLLLALPLFR